MIWLVVLAVGLAIVVGLPMGDEIRRRSRIERVKNPRPWRTPWLCRHGVHKWPSPPYDDAVCLRCGKPYLEP